MTSTFDRVKNRIMKKYREVGDYSKILELDLSQIKIKRLSQQMKQQIEKCKNLQSLLMCQCQLQTLDNLPQISSLTTLDLTTNKIRGSHVIYLKRYPQLISLYLIENYIQNTNVFNHLRNLKQLNSIDLTDNPVTKLENYRKQMFKILQIQVLDEKDQDGNTVYDDQDQYDEEDIDGVFQGIKQQKKERKKQSGDDTGDKDQQDEDQEQIEEDQPEVDEDYDQQEQDDGGYDEDGQVKYQGGSDQEQDDDFGNESSSKGTKKSKSSKGSKQSKKGSKAGQKDKKVVGSKASKDSKGKKQKQKSSQTKSKSSKKQKIQQKKASKIKG